MKNEKKKVVGCNLKSRRSGARESRGRSMAEGPIALAAPSSSSSTAHCVNGKVPPRKNGLTNGCSMSMPDLKNGFNQESSSKKSTQDIVPKNKPKEIGTNQNEDNKQDGGTITEIETVQNEVNSSPTAPQGEVLVTSATQLLAAVEPSGTIIKIEIVKSILYGGLTELIASLGVVTSAASTKTTTGKVVALSLASLITGLFVMTYKISDLWMNKQQTGSHESNDENDEQYEELFGDRKNYRLHFTTAMLSFVSFGLVPPLVYGFTFRNPEDKNLKIPTVTIAAVLCIALLGAIKAYIGRQNNCVGYINTIGKCIVDATGTAILTTIGGDIIGNYIDQLGWFEPNKIPTLFLPSMSFHNRTRGAFRELSNLIFF